MKSTLELLSLKEKQALAHFIGTDAHKALIKLVALTKHNAGTRALSATDFYEVKHLQGQKHSLEMLLQTIEKMKKD